MKKTAELTLYRICQSCGYFKPKDPSLTDEFCTRCGDRLIGHCSQCNLEITDPFAKYCRKCGQSVNNYKVDNLAIKEKTKTKESK